MQECFSKHSRMGTARMKYNKEKGKKGASMERSKAGTKEKSFDGITVAPAYRPLGSPRPEPVDELHYEPNILL